LDRAQAGYGRLNSLFGVIFLMALAIGLLILRVGVRVDLAPGTYQLVPVSPHPGMPPFGQSQTITVVAGLYSQVTIAYDSGIR